MAVSLLLTLAAGGIGYDTGFPGMTSRSSLSGFTPLSGAAAIIIQVLSGALGGYVAGRTRTIWTGLHDDESHFRDTAHGLIAWAVATVGGVLLAGAVLGPYAAGLASGPVAVAADPVRAAHIAAQASLFIAIGMLLSAFVAAVAARIGGLRHEEMVAKGRA